MQNSNDKQDKKREASIAEDVGIILTLVLAFIAVSLVTYNVIALTTPDLFSIWVALPVGFLAGVLILIMYVSSFGKSLVEINIASVVIIIFSLLFLPVAPRMKAQRLRRKGIVPTQIQSSPRVQSTTR